MLGFQPSSGKLKKFVSFETSVEKTAFSNWTCDPSMEG